MMDLQKQILAGYDIEIHSYKNNKIDDIGEFIKKVDEITDLEDGSIIQLLDTNYICGRKHLNQAIAQAIKAFDDEQNFAKDKGLEICVRLSAQKQITQALEMLGIKNSGDITAVYINTNPEQVQLTEQLLNTCDDNMIDVYDEELIRKAYDITEYDDDPVDIINEKIAMLALY